MSDRWGPSEDCEICGQPKSFGHPCRVCEMEWLRQREYEQIEEMLQKKEEDYWRMDV